MVELFEQEIKTDNRQSSKGNQLKWQKENEWYKADYTGYEGLAEYVVSGLLKLSSFDESEFVSYETEQIAYKFQRYRGCRSGNFLPEGWQLFTLERLFQSMYGQSLNRSIYAIRDYRNRIRFLVEQTERMTGLSDFGEYVSKLLTIDALFLNEDRHTHNIAVLRDEKNQFHLCPFFDHGAALLSDTAMDYPMEVETGRLIQAAKAKTFCQDFEEQLECAEQLYGRQLTFRFNRNDVQRLLDKEQNYPPEIRERVMEILVTQRRKYQYLFVD